MLDNSANLDLHPTTHSRRLSNRHVDVGNIFYEDVRLDTMCGAPNGDIRDLAKYRVDCRIYALGVLSFRRSSIRCPPRRIHPKPLCLGLFPAELEWLGDPPPCQLRIGRE